MREIKFRFWREQVNRFRFFDISTGFNVENSDVFKSIEQFTGLQDKNGVDIYEGDIVSITYHGTNSISKYKPKQVRWDLGKCGFNISKGIEVEVLGNIHENEGLFNGVK